MHHGSVLLLGGSGFIGTHIAARLAASGRHVIVPTRRYNRARHLQVLPTVQVTVADIFDPAVLDRLLPRVDCVINLLGVLHSWPARPWGRAFEHAHVALPRLLVQVCARHGIKRVLHMSALGAAIDGPSMYSRSKAAGERILLDAKDMQVTSFRPSVVFGAEDSFLNLFAKLQSLAPIMPLGGADTRFQPVYVGDVAQAFVDALSQPDSIGHVYELVGPRVYRLRELVHLAGKYSGHGRPVIGLPDWVARLQALMLELMPGPTLMSRDNLDSMKQDNIASGQYPTPPHWQPTPLEAVAPDYLRPSA